MKHEIAKKTLLYRILGFGLSMFITTLIFFDNPILSINVSLATEISAVLLYYLYEYFWRKYVERINLKKGSHILLVPDTTARIAYNVIEVLEDNKMIIEVV